MIHQENRQSKPLSLNDPKNIRNVPQIHPERRFEIISVEPHGNTSGIFGVIPLRHFKRLNSTDGRHNESHPIYVQKPKSLDDIGIGNDYKAKSNATNTQIY